MVYSIYNSDGYPAHENGYPKQDGTREKISENQSIFNIIFVKPWKLRVGIVVITLHLEHYCLFMRKDGVLLLHLVYGLQDHFFGWNKHAKH